MGAARSEGTKRSTVAWGPKDYHHHLPQKKSDFQNRYNNSYAILSQYVSFTRLPPPLPIAINTSRAQAVEPLADPHCTNHPPRITDLRALMDDASWPDTEPRSYGLSGVCHLATSHRLTETCSTNAD